MSIKIKRKKSCNRIFLGVERDSHSEWRGVNATAQKACFLAKCMHFRVNLLSPWFCIAVPTSVSSFLAYWKRKREMRGKGKRNTGEQEKKLKSNYLKDWGGGTHSFEGLPHQGYF